MSRRFGVPLALGVAFLLLPTSSSFAQSESGIQISPDEKRVLVSKDVAGLRWAISRNDDGTVTGNVFSPDGGPPQFVWCNETGRKGSDVSYTCSGADACPLSPCETDEWVFIADVVLPDSFFAADATTDSVTSSVVFSSAPRPMHRFDMARVAGSAVENSPSGIQITPDQLRALISKDVGIERWAITRNADGSVTGNVFDSTGGEPSFVSCARTGEGDGIVSFRCEGADPCRRGEACAPSSWTFIADVDLPASFLEPRSSVELETIEAVLTATLGEDDAIAAVVLAFDRGYSLRQILRAGLTDRLSVDGIIVEKSGATEAPADQPRHIFSAAADPAGALGGGQAPSLLDFVDKLGDGGGRFALVALLGLLQRGYSYDQIMDELFFGDGEFRFSVIYGPSLYRPGSDDRIFPDGLPPKYIDPPAPTPTPDPQPTSEPTPVPTETPAPTDTPEPTDSPAPAPSPEPGPTATPDTCDGDTFECEGGCAPSGADCCDGEGGFCASGTVCVGDNKCCPAAAPVLCNDNCQSADAACCGNGIIESGEACDGADVGGKTCGSEGFGEGFLGCTNGCELDSSGCGCEAGFKECGGDCIPEAADCCGSDGAFCSGSSFCVNGACCGDGAISGDEVCDSPGDPSPECGPNSICRSDCSGCLFVGNDCEGHCCPGDDPTCISPTANCFCDEGCLEAESCCPDYELSCQ